MGRLLCKCFISYKGKHAKKKKKKRYYYQYPHFTKLETEALKD